MKKFKKLYLHLLSVLKEDLQDELKSSSFQSENLSDDMDDPMTSHEICEYFKIHPSTLERQIRQGLQFSSKGKNCKRLFTKRKYLRFIEQKKRK